MKQPFANFRALTALCCAAVLLAGCAGPAKKSEETAYFPPLPQSPKLQFLLSITAEEDFGGEASSGLKDWLVGGSEKTKAIARPQDIASVKGKIYILDRTFRKVLFLDLAQKKLDFIKDEREGALSDPVGLWVTPDDIKYVADQERKQVVMFDAANRFVRSFDAEGRLERPSDVAAFGDRLYVTDFKAMVVQVLDRNSGKRLLTIGGPGGTEGQFNRPTHVTVDAKGNIYVNDSFNFRIQMFDPSGKYVKTFGFQGDTLGGFARPKGIAVDRDGYVYAVDTAFENVQIFEPESTNLVLFFGGYGPHTGSMYLPSGLHIDYDNVDAFQQYVDKDFKVKYLVLVGNSLGEHKLNVYGFGDWIGAPLPQIEIKPRLSPEAEAKAAAQEKATQGK